LEAAIGIEPMNKGFAVLKSQFLCVIRIAPQCFSINSLLSKSLSEYLSELLDTTQYFCVCTVSAQPLGPGAGGGTLLLEPVPVALKDQYFIAVKG
jgi:hypothetical protein